MGKHLVDHLGDLLFPAQLNRIDERALLLLAKLQLHGRIRLHILDIDGAPFSHNGTVIQGALRLLV